MTKWQLWKLRHFFPNMACICTDSAFMGRSTPTTAFDSAIWYFAFTFVDTLNRCMKVFGSRLFFDKKTAMRQFFRYKLWCWELLGVNIFVYFILPNVPDCNLKDQSFTDSTEILFSRLRSAGLNYHLSFFTGPYCAGFI